MIQSVLKAIDIMTVFSREEPCLTLAQISETAAHAQKHNTPLASDTDITRIH